LQLLYPFSIITKDGGFQAHLKLHYAKVRNFIPMYGCKQNQGAVHKSTNQVVACSSIYQPYVIYNHLMWETFVNTARQIFMQSFKEGGKIKWA
jgi:hypothetical protein